MATPSNEGLFSNVRRFSSGNILYRADQRIATLKLSFEKVDEGKHFYINAGCKTLVVHNFEEAQTELMKLFKKEYASFFDEDKKRT